MIYSENDSRSAFLKLFIHLYALYPTQMISILYKNRHVAMENEKKNQNKSVVKNFMVEPTILNSRLTLNCDLSKILTCCLNCILFS